MYNLIRVHMAKEHESPLLSWPTSNPNVFVLLHNTHTLGLCLCLSRVNMVQNEDRRRVLPTKCNFYYFMFPYAQSDLSRL